MSPALAAIIEEAYAVFRAYRLDGPLIVCNCPVCMPKQIEAELAVTPLRAIPSSLLAQYTNSAHGYDDGGIARQLRYFLPRYLELIANNDPPDNIGLAICLRRLESAHWASTWPAHEADVIQRFFDAFAADAVHRLETTRWPVGDRLTFDYCNVLTMTVTAGGDIDRVLRAWDDAPDPPAAIHMAALRPDILYETGRTYLYSAFLPDHPQSADRIAAFLLRPEVTQRIEAAFFAVGSPALQEILSDGLSE